MKIYSLDTIDFTYNGYGFLTDIISAEVNEEINGEYTLDMEYLLNGHLAEYLERENIIVCKVADGTEQPFRIKYIDRNFKTIRIKAYHISYDLGDDLVVDIAPTNLNAQAFGRWVLNNSTTHAATYTFNSDIATINSARYIRKNVLECFMSDDDNSMLKKFGGEFQRDGYNINLKSRIGEDTGVKLLVGKNINEITITIDDTSLYTRIVPVGYDGLTLPEIYVDSILINNYPFPKGCVIKFEDIKYDETGEDPEAYHDINDFYDALRDAAENMFNEGLDKPLINVDIDWLDLSKTKEYENYTSLETIRLGDTLTCDMNNFQYTTRVIATTYDVLLDRITNFQIGKPLASYASQMNATIQEVENQDFSSLLEQAQENASNLLKNAMTGYIYFDYDNGNLYIMDNPDPDDAVKVWRWNLNGLGYSSTGINGTYGLAITMDGSIVADYITTGTLNTNVIQGYDSLVASVEDIENLLLEENGIGTLTFEGASYNTPYYIKVNPTSTDVSLTYPNNVLYPSSTLFMQIRRLKFLNTTTTEVFYYDLPCDLLYYDSTHFDTLTIDGKNLTCIKTKMVDIDSYGVKSIATTESIEYEFNLPVLTAGDYQVSMLTYDDVNLDIKLVRQNDLTNVLASTAYVGSKITQTKNELELQVQQKVNDDEIIAKLNLAVEDGQGIVELTGNSVIINSDNFQLDANGDMVCHNGTFNGGNISLYGSQYDWTTFNIKDNDRREMYISPGSFNFKKVNDENNQVSIGASTYNIYSLDDNLQLTSIGASIISNGNYMDLWNLYTVAEYSTFDLWGNGANTIKMTSADGTIYASAFVNTSTEDKKKNIKKLEKALDTIKNVDICEYNWNSEKKNADKHYGMVIGDKYNTPKEFIHKNKEGKEEGIDIYATLSFCIKAIQEQQEQIDELKEEIKKLKEVNKK